MTRRHTNYGSNLINTTEQDYFLVDLLMRTKKEPRLIMFQGQDYNSVTRPFHDMKSLDNICRAFI